MESFAIQSISCLLAKSIAWFDAVFSIPEN
jgi:hypothetical protein